MLNALAYALMAASSAPEPTIEVFGRSMARDEARAVAQDYVRKAGVANQDRPIARWTDPVCPRAIGLAPGLAARVEAGIRDVAKRVGVAVAKPDCRPNLAVLFVRNAGQEVQSFRKHTSLRLTEVSARHRERLLSDETPIRWWYTTDLRQKQGGRQFSPGGGMSPVENGNGEGGRSSIPGGAPMLQQYSSSLISTAAIRAIVNATVMVDVDKASGAPLDGVVDYAALVGLSEIDAADQPSSQSILSLFSKERVGALSSWDELFLRSLYALPHDRSGHTQRGLLVDRLTKAFAAPES